MLYLEVPVGSVEAQEYSLFCTYETWVFFIWTPKGKYHVISLSSSCVTGTAEETLLSVWEQYCIYRLPQ